MNTPTNVEWIGGITLLPVKLTPTSPQQQPEVLLWLSADGQVVGQALQPPGQLLARASEHLRLTIQKPLDGPTPAPTRVRVASSELADALRPGHPGLQIVVAPTPELDELVAALGQELSLLGEENDRSYLANGLTPDSVAAFFLAAGELWRACPWVNLKTQVIELSSQALGLEKAVLFLEGEPGGEVCGWLLFPGRQAFVDYFEPSQDEDSGLPSLAFNFELDGDVSDAMRAEVDEHEWFIASPKAYPIVSAVDEYGAPHAPTPQELHRAEALCHAVSALVENGTGRLTLEVKTHSGEIDCQLTAIEDEKEGEIARLERTNEELRDELGVANEELLARFQASPEAKSLPGVEFIPSLIDDANDTFGMTVATLGPVELTDLVFTERTVADPFTFKRVVAEVRAFYLFLKREFGLRQADDCLLVVSEGATEMMRGLTSASSGGSSGRRQSSEDAAAKKKKRKAAKKARRKNRA